MLKIRSNKQGFSLIELLVTIAIIGILSAVAVPAYQGYQKQAKKGVTESILFTAIRTIQLNQSLGKSSDSGDIANSIKSKGASIPTTGQGALKISGASNTKVLETEKTYCVSVTEKAGKGAYLAGCSQVNSTIGVCSDSGNVSCSVAGPKVSKDDCIGVENCSWTPTTTTGTFTSGKIRCTNGICIQ